MKISIFDYRDYREFLKDKFDEIQLEKPHFSYTYCSQKLDTARSYLKMVFSKSRHMTLEKLFDVSQLFELSEVERDYIQMVFLSNTSNRVYLQEHFSHIAGQIHVSHTYAQKYKTESEEIKELERGMSKSMLMQIIHSMASGQNFKAEPGWILEKMNLKGYTEADITKSLSYLKEKELLITDESGNLKPHRKSYTVNITGDSRASLTILEPVFDVLKESVRSPAHFDPCYFYDANLALNKDDRNKALELISKLRDDLLDLNEKSQNPTEFILVSNNFTCLAKIED